jgi:putative FmdB family regulatory protein
MPIYEYECGSCSHRFEKKQDFSSKPVAACPKCKAKAKRVFHPAPIIFKGSGFYVTDHRPSEAKNPASELAKKETPPAPKDKSESAASKSK